MRRVSLVVLFAASVLAVSIPGPVHAQVDGYHFTGINFNFANPGARARGIGGAFVALADDSSAALANPAGIAFLDRQFSLELIHDEDKSPVGQQTQGDVTTTGVLPDVNFTVADDPYRVWSDSDSNRINNASFVFPIPKANLGIAIYYAALADLRQEYDVGAGLMCDDNGNPFLPGAGGGCGTNDPYFYLYTPFSVTAKLESELIGASLGWKIGDSFAIGGSVAYASTTFSGSSISPGIQDDAGNPLTAQLTETSTIDDDDVMYSLGFLYRGGLVGVGLNYRSAMSFGIDSDILDGNGNPIEGQAFTGEFRIPERFAAGLAFFPGDHWVIATEYVRIPYSTIPKGMPEQFDITRQLAGAEYSSSDIDEIHVGAEYTTFSSGRGWSIRAGYWRDESHLTYSTQGYNIPVQTFEDLDLAGTALLYEKLELSFDHFTAGFGAALGKFRFDLAVDYSPDVGTDFLLSGVFYF